MLSLQGRGLWGDRVALSGTRAGTGTGSLHVTAHSSHRLHSLLPRGWTGGRGVLWDRERACQGLFPEGGLRVSPPHGWLPLL